MATAGLSGQQGLFAANIRPGITGRGVAPGGFGNTLNRAGGAARGGFQRFGQFADSPAGQDFFANLAGVGGAIAEPGTPSARLGQLVFQQAGARKQQELANTQFNTLLEAMQNSLGGVSSGTPTVGDAGTVVGGGAVNAAAGTSSLMQSELSRFQAPNILGMSGLNALQFGSSIGNIRR